MNKLLTLTESDESLEILPVDAKLSIEADTTELTRLLQRTTSIANDKELIPGTNLVVLEASMGGNGVSASLKATATDGEKTLSMLISRVKVAMPGTAQIPAKRLFQIIKSCPEDRTTITVSGTDAVITSGRARWTVQTPAKETYLALTDLSEFDFQSVDRYSLLSAILAVRKSVSPSASRVSLMQLDIRNGEATGCDGGRVHRQIIKGMNPQIEFGIPYQAISHVVKMLEASDEEYVHVRHSDYAFELQVGSDSFISQQLTIDFPDIENMLLNPSISNTNTMSVETENLVEAIKRVRVNSDPDYLAIFLAIIPGAKQDDGGRLWTLNVKAKDKQGNSAQELLPVSWKGIAKPKELCVNYHSLLDLLESYGEETAILSIGEDTKSQKYPILVESLTNGFKGAVTQTSSEYL